MKSDQPTRLFRVFQLLRDAGEAGCTTADVMRALTIGVHEASAALARLFEGEYARRELEPSGRAGRQTYRYFAMLGSDGPAEFKRVAPPPRKKPQQANPAPADLPRDPAMCFGILPPQARAMDAFLGIRR